MESEPARECHDVSDDALPYIWHLLGEDALTQRFLLVAKMMERVTSRKLQDEFGLSVAQWRVLAFVCISGPASASFIGEAVEADQAEISRAVKTLIDSRLVTRDFEPGSRKTLIVSPTDAGKDLFLAIREHRRKYFSCITGQLDAAQKQSLNTMLTTLVHEVVKERSGSRSEPQSSD